MSSTPPLSPLKNYSTRKEWLAAAWKEFVKHLGQLSVEQRQELIEKVTTPTERELIIRRAIARSRFEYSVGFREIGRETWLSSQTLSAIKRALLGTKKYESNWNEVKIRMEKKRIEKMKLLKERPIPARYRSTKYGKLRIHY